MQRIKLKPTNAVEEGRMTKNGKGEGVGEPAPEVVAGNGSARRCTRTRQACSSVKWVRQAAASSQVPAGSLCNCNGASLSSLGGTEGGPRLMLAVLLQQLKASSMLEMQSKCKTTANYVESEWRSEGEAGGGRKPLQSDAKAVHDKRTSRGRGSGIGRGSAAETRPAQGRADQDRGRAQVICLESALSRCLFNRYV